MNFLLAVLLGILLHRAWSELQFRREERWFRSHPETVNMALRTMARRN